MKELGLMGSLPVFKKDNQYFLIAGHHRVEALKRTFGKEHEISVDIKDYSEDQILRGMVVENLTQRDNEAKEIMANLTTIRKHLVKEKMLLDDDGKICPTVGHISTTKPFELGSIRQITLFS